MLIKTTIEDIRVSLLRLGDMLMRGHQDGTLKFTKDDIRCRATKDELKMIVTLVEVRDIRNIPQDVGGLMDALQQIVLESQTGKYILAAPGHSILFTKLGGAMNAVQKVLRECSMNAADVPQIEQPPLEVSHASTEACSAETVTEPAVEHLPVAVEPAPTPAPVTMKEFTE